MLPSRADRSPRSPLHTCSVEATATAGAPARTGARLASSARIERLRLATLALLALLVALLAPAGAQAAARAFTNSYAQTLHGDIAMIGNANSTCRAAWTGGCTPNALGNGNSNNAFGALVDVDGVAATTNSSSSTLALPAGAVVRSARLLWGSAGDGTDNNGEQTVSFDTPATAGIAYGSITAGGATGACGSLANLASSNTRGFACASDVTALVQAGGSGTYTLGAIEQRSTSTSTVLPDHWSGWGLYVVYELASEPLRRIVLADGFQRVGAGAPATITATGFVAPAAGTVSARLTYMVGEGDSEISGDNATFGTRTLDTAATPNLMDSEIRGLTYQSAKNPNYVNHYGFDVHSVDVDGGIPNAATSANFSFTSTQDVYYPFALGIAIELGEPELVLTKTLTDINGGAVEPGDVLEYQIVATNTGNDGAAQVTITDPIPADTAYVAGSMQIAAGANAGNKTDAAGDDQATFAGNQVTIRVGAGANATTGGVLAANGGTTTVRFRVTIDVDADEGVPLVNTASGSYVGQTSLLGYADPSSVAATPVRRADMVVTQTPSAALTAGQAGSLTLTASNIGGASTYGQPVTVQTTIPAGITFGSITASPGWTCTTTLPTISCTRSDALAGDTAYPDIVLAVTPTQTATTVTFNSQVSGGNEVRTNNNTDSDAVTILRSANLRIVKTVDRATAAVGDVLTYTLTATNLGPSNTSGVSVGDTLPPTLQPLTATTTQGTCSTAGQTVTCPVGVLNDGAGATVTITARVLAAGAGTSIVNPATITGTDPDPATPNNSSSATTAIDQAANLQVTKSVAPAAQNANGNVTWTVTVRNNGPGTATGVSLSDDLPAGITVQSITPSQGTCGTGDPFTCNLGTLVSGATATVAVAARPSLATAGTTLTNSATATSTSFDPDSTDNTATSGLAVNPAADVRVTKTADRATANVDENITWSVALSNLGPSPAAGVTLTDTAPAGVTIQSVTPPAGVTCSTAGQTISCAVTGTLAAGATRTVTIVARVNRASAGSPLTNAATGASSTFDPDTSNNLSSVTTNVNNAADLRVSKTADRATANVGDTISWTVTATNDGASPATGVQLTDVLPAGVTLLTRVPSQGTCSVVGAQIACAVGTLAVNASATLTVTARVDRAAAETPLQNVAQVTGAEFDPDTANNSTNVTTTVGPATDLQLTKGVDRATAAVGDTVTYTLTARNDGPSAATNVVVTDALPAGFVASGTPTVTGGTCTLTGQNLSCTIANLANGGARSISVPGTIAAAAAGATLTNAASISGTQFDQDPSNNTTPAVTTQIAGVANLAITKTVDRAAASVGDTLTYTLTVTNSGPQSATGTTVVDTLPAGVTRLGATPSQGSCPAGSPITCNLGTIPSGGSATITVTARVGLAAANATATNSATVDAAQDDLTPGNDTATATTAIAPAADLRIDKTADRPTADVGDTITWTLTATNDGPQSATGVTVTDTIPSGVTLQQPITGLPSGVTCSVAGAVVSCPVSGAITSGASVVITLRGTVQRAAAETPQENVATVAGSQLDPDTADNTSRVTTTINAAADLRVAKTVNTPTANVNDTLTWTVAVTNDGPSVATGVQLIDDLPAGTTLLTRSASQGTCSSTAAQVICAVGTLAPGASATATITARVERAAAESPVNNAARATATQLDPDTANNLATASTTIGPATDLRIGKTVNTATANVGQTITYTLAAVNDGPSAATGVVVTDTLPSTLLRTGAITASQGACSQAGQTITCNVGGLASGGSATITLQAVVQPSAAASTVANSATIAGGQLDPDPSNNASPAASTAVAAAADLAVDLTVDRATADVGDTLIYTWAVHNNGPSTATGVAYTVPLPATVQPLTFAVNGPELSCAPGPGVLTCTGSIASGATSSGSIRVRVLPAASGTSVAPNSSVTATTFDPVSANNADGASTTVGPAADLQLTKSVNRASANIGDSLTYTLVVTNNGPATATGVTITDAVPSSLLITGTPTATQGACTVSGQNVTCTPGAVANGGAVTVTINATIRASAAGTTVGNTASVDGNEHDPTPANDTSLTTSTNVAGAADLAVDLAVNNATANVGDTLTYTWSVANNGPTGSSGVVYTPVLPAAIQVLSYSAGTGLSCTGAGVPTCSGTLANGATASGTITARVLPAASGSTQTATSSVTASTFDPVSSNNSDDATTTVALAADLQLTKSVDRATANIGDLLTFTLVGTNSGPAAATGVTITDTLPSTLSVVGTPTATQGACTVAGQTVTCAPGAVANGASVTATITARVLAAASASTVSNTATIDGSEHDPTPANDTSLATSTAVGSTADLVVSQVVDQPTVNVGGTATYTVTVRNDGPQTATAVALANDLPSGATVLSVTPSQGTCGTGDPFSCALGTLASGASATVAVNVRITGAAESVFSNQASATATQFDPNTSNNAATAATSTNPAADLRIVKTADRATADVGETITWTVTAFNDGPSTATGVVVTDTAPAGVTLLAPSGLPAGVTCSVAGQVVSCSRSGSLASGSSVAITLRGTVNLAAAGTPLSNSATVAGSQFDPDTSDNLSAVTTNVNAAADLRVAKSVNAATANVGDTLTWTVIATNDGPSAATSVVVTDDLPAGVTLLTRASTQGSCAPSGAQVVCAIGTLASGATATVTLTARVERAAAESPVDNGARVTSAVFDPDTADNLSTASTAVGPAADLRLAKTVDRPTANVGDVLTYTLTATNDGPSNATGATITDTLPTGLQIVSTPTASQGACTVTGQTVTCSLGTITNGASATATIQARVRPGASASTVGNTATVTGTRLDPDPSNDSSGPPVTTTVGAAADLVVTHVATPTTLNLGDTADFTITVRNTGPSTATNVQLSDDLPAGTTLISRTTSQGTCAASGDPLVCSLGALVSGATATIVVRLRVDTGAGAVFTAAATATATEYEPTPADNAASAAVSTGAAADLRLAKTADRATADVGEAITWTLTATNDGPSAATGATITDTVPSGITGVTATAGAGVTCNVVGQAVSCAVAGAWASGASRTVTLRGTVARSSAGSPLSNSATVAGNEFDPDLADNVSVATTNVNAAADLRVTKTADRSAAQVGDVITWTVAATNDGPSAASAATITDDLPTGVTLLTATATQGTCGPVGAQVVCSAGPMASGQTVTATITARVEAIAAETPLANVARVAASTFDPDAANNLSTVTTTVGASIDLSTSAAVNLATANVGDELLYTFTIANAGPSTATGATFTHLLPANTTYVASTSTQGGCSASSGTLTCNLGALAGTGNATVTVRVRVGSGAAGTTVNARGVVTATQPDRNPANDQSAIVSTAVAPAADLLVTVSADQPTVAVGGSVTYLVTVTNDGPSTATNVVLTNQLPAGATIVSATPSTGTCSAGDPRSCAFGTLAAGATATLTVVARAETANAGALMTNRASAVADQFDPTTANNAAQASSAVGDAADLRIVKTVDRATAEIGDTVTWTLTASNLGPLGATGVSVSDAVPAGVTIASATTSAGTCTVGAPITCSLGALANGANATITVVGTIGRAAAGTPLNAQATVTGAQLDPNPANNVSAAPTTVGPAADLRVAKLVSSSAPGIGDAVTWTIQVFNDGPQAASAVQVTDAVPAGAPISSVTSSAGTCTRTGQSVTCALGTIPSGGSATVTIAATVASGAGGAVLDNAASASSATRDPDVANNTATARATAGGAADLSVAVSPDRPSAVVGEEIGWTAVVGNAGPQAASGVVLTLVLPTGLVDPRATVPGGTCTVAAAVVTCTVPDLAPGNSAVVALTGTAGRAAAETSLIVAGTVAGTLPDPAPANNAASAGVVSVPAAVDLVVTKRTDKPSAAVGEQVTITTDVLNRGPSTATDVTLVDTLPEGVALESVTPSQGSCTVADRTITCNLGSIADGQTVSVAVVVTVQAAGADQSLLNAGTANSGQFDTDGSNNDARVTTGGQPPTVAAPKPAITITKSVSKTSVAAGDEVVWTVTAKNTSNAVATGVRIVDQLPAGLDYVSTKATGATCTRNARTITCLVSRMEPGRVVTIKISTAVAVPGAPIDNIATVTAAELPDARSAGQVAGARVQAAGAPFVVAGIKPLEPYSRPGRRVRIAVKVTNVGAAGARDVRACFTLPKSVVLLRRPPGVTQRGAQFCLSAASLEPGKNKRVVLSARVVGGAGTTRAKLKGTASNSRVKVESYPLEIRGQRPTRAAGVTG